MANNWFFVTGARDRRASFESWTQFEAYMWDGSDADWYSTLLPSVLDLELNHYSNSEYLSFIQSGGIVWAVGGGSRSWSRIAGDRSGVGCASNGGGCGQGADGSGEYAWMSYARAQQLGYSEYCFVWITSSDEFEGATSAQNGISVFNQGMACMPIEGQGDEPSMSPTQSPVSGTTTVAPTPSVNIPDLHIDFDHLESCYTARNMSIILMVDASQSIRFVTLYQYGNALQCE